jgi:hypothetical protein
MQGGCPWVKGPVCCRVLFWLMLCLLGECQVSVTTLLDSSTGRDWMIVIQVQGATGCLLPPLPLQTPPVQFLAGTKHIQSSGGGEESTLRPRICAASTEQIIGHHSTYYFLYLLVLVLTCSSFPKTLRCIIQSFIWYLSDFLNVGTHSYILPSYNCFWCILKFLVSCVFLFIWFLNFFDPLSDFFNDSLIIQMCPAQSLQVFVFSVVSLAVNF